MEASKPGAGHFGLVRRFPIGVILGITPFNFPLNLVAHKVAPCLASGNTMVLKPSPRTPLSALLLAEVLDEAGIPAGQVNVIPFDHSHVAGLLSDSRLKMLSFTGSAEVGWQLKSRAGKMLLLNASRDFVKGDPKNFLPEEAVTRIADTFLEWKEIEKFSRIVGTDEIAKNDFNISPSRYLHTGTADEYQPLAEIVEELRELDDEARATEKKLNSIFSALGV
jgi:hypothetical protein